MGLKTVVPSVISSILETAPIPASGPQVGKIIIGTTRLSGHFAVVAEQHGPTSTTAIEAYINRATQRVEVIIRKYPQPEGHFTLTLDLDTLYAIAQAPPPKEKQSNAVPPETESLAPHTSPTPFDPLAPSLHATVPADTPSPSLTGLIDDSAPSATDNSPPPPDLGGRTSG
jgi:hypothetical protein